MKKIMISIIALAFALPVNAKETTGFGLNLGAGTDISLGLAAGAGASYLMLNEPAMSVEIGFNVFFSGYKESSMGEPPFDHNLYYDAATTIIYAVVANALFNYDPAAAGLYTLAGIGAGGVSLSWEKSSIDDPSYNSSGDDTGGSAIINLGLGGTFGNGFELRLQLPVLITFTAFGGTLFSPALTIGAGLRL